ncbi:hypothetical protein K440DRAFT_423189 [Wilcoxina mikolae CBS 423.85]|nr:hypothetical protein K440DRAFT_423189 [Wilcoxina mikolae CBS 423.85]
MYPTRCASHKRLGTGKSISIMIVTGQKSGLGGYESEHRLIKPGRWIVSTVSLNRDDGAAD